MISRLETRAKGRWIRRNPTMAVENEPDVSSVKIDRKS
jgi:hypothetical protein